MGSNNKNKAVRIDEGHNETREVPRIPKEWQTDMWVTKAQVRQFRQEAQEEAMMEQARGMVLSILQKQQQETTLASDKQVEEQLESILNGGVDAIVQFLEEHGETITQPEGSNFSYVSEGGNQRMIHSSKVVPQETAMMQQVRKLVQGKLMEHKEMFASKQDFQHILHQLVGLPKEEILSFLEAPSAAVVERIASMKQQEEKKKNWILECSDYWNDLPVDIKAAAQVLGYTEALWDEATGLPDECNKWWQELNLLQLIAAEKLGYDQSTWDTAGEDAAVAAEEGVIAVPDPSSAEAPTKKQRKDETVANATDARLPNTVSDDEEQEDSGGGEEGAVDEFLFNFLSSPESETADANNDSNQRLSLILQAQPGEDKNTSHLQQMYVPSDDEFELGDDDEEDEDHPPESSPLLGDTNADPLESPLLGSASEAGEKQSLIKHRHGRTYKSVATDSKVDSGTSLPGSDDDNKSKKQPHNGKWRPTHTHVAVIAATGLLLLWLGQKAIGYIGGKSSIRGSS